MCSLVIFRGVSGLTSSALRHLEAYTSKWAHFVIFSGVSGLTFSALRHLEACLGSRPLPLKLFGDRPGLNHGLLLLTGPKGSGKTSLAAALCQAMSRAPTLAYTLTVDCKPLRGEGTHRGLVTTTVHASRSSTALLFLKLW